MTNAIEATGPNAEQIAYWNGVVGEKWINHQDALDRMLEPISTRLIAAAALKAGDQVLDIGCGCGATSLEIADLIGARGSVTGIDISAPMLAHATARAAAKKKSKVLDFLLADAATHAFPQGAYDLALSRFGVMFFAEPAAAFANIRKGLKRRGRLVFMAWQALAANAWVTVPLSAMLAHLPPPAPQDPLAPGPFAFADADRVRSVLDAAGFTDIDIAPEEFQLRLGGDLDAACNFAGQIGPNARLLAEVDEPVREMAVAAMRKALAAHVTPAGLALGGACWLVTARA